MRKRLRARYGRSGQAKDGKNSGMIGRKVSFLLRLVEKGKKE